MNILLLVFHGIDCNYFNVRVKPWDCIEVRSCLTAEYAPLCIKHHKNTCSWQCFVLFTTPSPILCADVQHQKFHQACVVNNLDIH